MSITTTALLVPANAQDVRDARSVFCNAPSSPYQISDVRGKKRVTQHGKTPTPEHSQKNRGVEAVMVHLLFMNNKNATQFGVLPVEADWDKHVTIAQDKYAGYDPRQKAILTARLLSCAMILPEQKKHVAPLAATLHQLQKKYVEAAELSWPFRTIYPQINDWIGYNTGIITQIREPEKVIERLKPGYPDFDGDAVDFCTSDAFWESKRLVIEADAPLVGRVRNHCRNIHFRST